MNISTDIFKIFNGQVITPYRIIKNGAVIVRNGIIEAVAEGNPEMTGVNGIDAKGNYIAPGLIFDILTTSQMCGSQVSRKYICDFFIPI